MSESLCVCLYVSLFLSLSLCGYRLVIVFLSLFPSSSYILILGLFLSFSFFESGLHLRFDAIELTGWPLLCVFLVAFALLLGFCSLFGFVMYDIYDQRRCDTFSLKILTYNLREFDIHRGLRIS